MDLALPSVVVEPNHILGGLSFDVLHNPFFDLLENNHLVLVQEHLVQVVLDDLQFNVFLVEFSQQNLKVPALDDRIIRSLNHQQRVVELLGVLIDEINGVYHYFGHVESEVEVPELIFAQVLDHLIVSTDESGVQQGVQNQRLQVLPNNVLENELFVNRDLVENLGLDERRGENDSLEVQVLVQHGQNQHQEASQAMAHQKGGHGVVDSLADAD